jgi:hypothetical protein
MFNYNIYFLLLRKQLPYKVSLCLTERWGAHACIVEVVAGTRYPIITFGLKVLAAC